jgi:hypothetical protein
MTCKYYDIIGDIHGQANKLINLLEKLGYQQKNGVYQKLGHQAVFVGDFIDRGKKQKSVIDIVRAMINQGHALAVMGNHEFNAICYHTATGNGDYLRTHNPSHTAQHQAFLNEYPVGAEETMTVINWFKTLPLFLEMEGLRVIHACWDQAMIEQIKPHLDQHNCLQPPHYFAASDKKTFFYQAIETLLKGPELALPNHGLVIDKDGVPRDKVRLKWWEHNLHTYKQAAAVSKSAQEKLLDAPIPATEKLVSYSRTAPPVFFGHYWFTGQPQIISANSVCLDYSAARTGPLVAYRFQVGQTELSNENFYVSDC